MIALLLPVLEGALSVFMGLLRSSVGRTFLACVLAAGVGFGAGLHLEKGRINALERVHQAAVAKARAEQAALDKLATESSRAEAAQQRKLAARYLALSKRVTDHVHSLPGNCITWGLVRVLDAAILGADPKSLNLPTGATDDACANVTAVTLASSVVANYGRAQQNAEQLEALQRFVKGLAAISR